MAGTLTITGDKQLLAKLREIGSRRRLKTVCNKALGAGAKPINRSARANIAARTERRTGRLRKGTEITRVATTRAGNWVRRVQTKRREFFAFASDSKWYYPAIVEAGHDHAEPRNFMRDAYRDGKEQAAAAVEQTLHSEVMKAAS